MEIKATKQTQSKVILGMKNLEKRSTNTSITYRIQEMAEKFLGRENKKKKQKMLKPKMFLT